MKLKPRVLGCLLKVSRDAIGDTGLVLENYFFSCREPSTFNVQHVLIVLCFGPHSLHLQGHQGA